MSDASFYQCGKYTFEGEHLAVKQTCRWWSTPSTGKDKIQTVPHIQAISEAILEPCAMTLACTLKCNLFVLSHNVSQCIVLLWVVPLVKCAATQYYFPFFTVNLYCLFATHNLLFCVQSGGNLMKRSRKNDENRKMKPRPACPGLIDFPCISH